MSLLEGLQILVIGLGTVFLVLISLSGAVALESRIFSFLNKSKKENPAAEISTTPEKSTVVNASVGELKLIDVDERTAAMIMAIVSDESQIPLSELNFKYIKAIN
ncbi:MAG TPA: OadG family protein [Clostridiaceae bacterium]|jgi:Na+-transporting methylmalonyl-CoA/oxaloacetate decarboxylase gamma subunit|nr:OadG family protein [Clostridiaceae bacterium]